MIAHDFTINKEPAQLDVSKFAVSLSQCPLHGVNEHMATT
jgi:hypothetical protein